MAPTLLIGLDGATFTILDPYVEAGVMPFLGELIERGTRAVLRSIMPPLTPPAWTSLVTGKRPGEHGVFDFFQKDEPGSIYYSFATSQSVNSATIWSLASDQGLPIISLNFPLMFPAPDVDGAVVPGGMMPWRQLRLGCHPPGLFQRLQALPEFEPRELLDMEMEIKAIDGCPESEYAEWVELHIRRERRWASILRHLMVEEPADLIGILFDGVDKLQHLCWRFIDPACRPAHPSAWEKEMIELVERYFRSLDGLLRELVELAGPQATVVIASDHGFGPTRDVFHVNSWLEQNGFLFWADAEDSGNGRSETDVGFAEMTRHVHALDWSRTLAFAATPSSQGIQIVEKIPGTSAAMPEEARSRIADELARGLRELRGEDGRPVVEEVWTSERAFPGPFQALGPDLSMVLADGGTMSILPSETLLARRDSTRGHHRWEGTFIAAGPGIRAGAAVRELSIVDVAPLLLHQLGLAIPDDMAGELPVEIFTERALAERPPRWTAAAPPPQRLELAEEDVELEPEERAALVERLRALGYVE